jgi:DNA-binding IclR family transcriptional regulator
LAFCDPEDLDAYFDDRQLDRLTENTITDWEVLQAELREIRRVGIAYDHEEFDEGIGCVGAVILGANGEPVGAYAAALPIARFEAHQESVAADLTKAAEQASRALGYVGTYPPG